MTRPPDMESPPMQTPKNISPPKLRPNSSRRLSTSAGRDRSRVSHGVEEGVAPRYLSALRMRT